MGKEKNKVDSSSMFKLLKRSLRFAKPFLWLFILVMILNAGFSIFSAMSIAVIKPVFEVLFSTNTGDVIPVAANPNFFQSIKDSFFNFLTSIIHNPDNLQATLINLSMLVLSLFLIKNIFKYLGSVVNVKLQEGIVKDMRNILFRKLTDLSLDFFSKRKSGSLLTVLISDIQVVNTSNISVITGLARDLLEVGMYIFLLLAVSPKLCIIAFSTSLISFGTLRLAMKYIKRYSNRMQNALSDYTNSLQETLYGIRVVKAYNAEKHANERFSLQTGKYVKAAVKLAKISSLMPSMSELFAIIALCFVFFFGGSEVLSGHLKPDDLMLFLFTLFASMSPLTAIINNIAQFQRGAVSAERLFEILDQKPTVVQGTEPIENFSSSIDVQNVSFAYNDEQVIKDVSFKLDKSKKIAFVGASGSGKSTMLDLLIRFYDPREGKITIDGRNIKNLKSESYRKLFGIVSQETMLFNDTIANNIRYGLTEVPQQKIEEAARLANAYDFIVKMPDGFNTVIGERGVMLSGGERQRIAIARALLREPYILVFDEATSSLDAESEKIVQQAINDNLKNRTAVIVAHRLSTIIDCDEILVFDDGRIAERGNHRELYARNGIYTKLYEIQFTKKLLEENDAEIAKSVN